MKTLHPTTADPEVKNMKGNHLAWRLIGIFLGSLLVFGFIREAGAGSIIRLLGPKPGAALTGEITLQAVVESPEVSYVVFGVDDTRPHATNAAPYRYRLDTGQLSNGPHNFFAEAYSRGGLLGRSAPLRLVVKNYSQPRLSPSQPKTEIIVTNPGPAMASEPAVSAVALGKTRHPAAVAPMLSAEPKLSPEMIAGPQATALAKETSAYKATAGLPQAIITRPARSQELANFLLNGKAIVCDDTMTFENGRLQAGFRKIMEAAGWQVTWVAARKAGVATAGGYSLEVVLGEEQLFFGGKPYALGEKAVLSQNRLVVPLRPLCEASNMTLTWEAGSHTIRLISPYLAMNQKAAGEVIVQK
jgi:hypothetical protein